MSPSTINACKSNTVEATGLWGANACSTSVLAWAFRRSSTNTAHADPRVSIPVEQLKSWMSMWARASKTTRRVVERQWAKAYRIIAASKNRWMMVRGPISATIATVLDIGMKPVAPCRWMTQDGVSFSNFDHEPGISCFHVLDHMQSILEKKQWKAAGSHFNGEGLQDGIPSLTPASRAYSDLVKKGKLEEAAALEAIIANKVWGKERLLHEGIITSSDAGCDRCGADFDSDLHKF